MNENNECAVAVFRTKLAETVIGVYKSNSGVLN